MGSFFFSAVLVAQIYNGLLYADMGYIAQLMEKRGQHVEVLWHDAADSQTICPKYLLGHSMGGNAALRQATRCAARGKAPVVVVTIDPGRAPLFHQCPAHVKCVNFYNPAHPIGGQFVNGASNIVVEGYAHVQMPFAPSIVKQALALTAK